MKVWARVKISSTQGDHGNGMEELLLVVFRTSPEEKVGRNHVTASRRHVLPVPIMGVHGGR